MLLQGEVFNTNEALPELSNLKQNEKESETIFGSDLPVYVSERSASTPIDSENNFNFQLEVNNHQKFRSEVNKHWFSGYFVYGGSYEEREGYPGNTIHLW